MHACTCGAEGEGVHVCVVGTGFQARPADLHAG